MFYGFKSLLTMFIWKENKLLAFILKVIMQKVKLLLNRIITIIRFPLREKQIYSSK